jgi:hypothetical protein
MKYTILFLLIFSAIPLLAQQPTISYLMCDEAKSQLQIHGAFRSDSGSVMIEDTTLGIVSWSDSLIICSFPDSGKGAGGGVLVQTIHGLSNKRMLSIFCMRIDHPVWAWNHPGHGEWFSPYARTWVVTWRMDIAKHPIDSDQIISFEASRMSYGLYDRVKMTYYDSADYFDHGVSFWGVVDLNKYQIDFNKEKFKFGLIGFADSIYTPLSIKFDSSGFINGYRDIHIGDPNNPSDQQKTDSLYNQKILYPPNAKNVVIDKSKHTDVFRIWSKNQSIMIETESPLGSTTASLYSTDGRLLKRTMLNISAAGDYSIDVSDVHTHFAFLVLQTGKGVITRKVLLSEP